MFKGGFLKKKSSSKDLISTPQISEFEATKKLSLKLGGNNLVFVDGKRWINVSSDLDAAAEDIAILENENAQLKIANAALQAKYEQLDIIFHETIKLKSISMDMLTEEKQKNASLVQELNGYKEELKDSYAIIVNLRRSLSSRGTENQK